VERLKQLGAPKKGVYKGGYDGMMIQRKVMMKYGGYSHSAKKRGYFEAFVKPMILSGEYSLSDVIGVAIGHKFVLEKMWPQVAASKLAESCPRFEVPYFIFDGVHDKNTPAELVEEYFNAIDAPVKELIWFKDSGHNPMGDEPERFKSLLREKLKDIAASEKGKGYVV
jgi:pimeloyl-ACP methyl ester carboxylesterase